MFRTRWLRSGWPCGSRARCETFAPTKSIAEAFWQAATQAPQPMHAAASMARSASCFGMGMRVARPARRRCATEMKPPACWMRSKARAVDDQVLEHGKGAGAERLDDDGLAVREMPHVKLAGRRRAIGAVRRCR